MLLAILGVASVAGAQPLDGASAVPAPDVAVLTAHSPGAAEMLERGRQAFENAEYQRALDIFAPIDPLMLDLEQRIQLHEMLGKCRYILGDEDGAADEFFEILKLDKTHEMDPIRTPRDIDVLFKATAMQDANKKALRLFPVEPERTIPGWRVPKVARHNMFMAFMPAGVFRLAYLRTPRSGAPLLLGQLFTFGGSVASFVFLDWVDQGQCSPGVVAAAPVISVLNIVSFVLACTVYAVGIVDAFLSQRYHGPALGERKRKVSARWRWGPPPAVLAGPAH